MVTKTLVKKKKYKRKHFQKTAEVLQQLILHVSGEGAAMWMSITVVSGHCSLSLAPFSQSSCHGNTWNESCG